MRGPYAPLFGAAVVAVLVVGLLLWPMPLDPSSRIVAGAFHDGHVWCFWQMKQMLMGEAGVETSSIGWPTTVQAQLIGWIPGILVAPLQDSMGAVGAYNMALLWTGSLTVIFGGLLCMALGARPGSAAAGGLILALCPYALDALANGQIVKLQIWLLVAHLLVVWAAIRGWWRLPLVIPMSLGLAFTSPSLAMSLPFALAILVPVFVWHRPHRLRATLSGVVAVGLTAASLVWASGLYDLDPAQADRSAFFPASVPEGDYHALLEQIARLDSLFLGGVPKGFHADHVPYLGVSAVVIAILCSFRRFPGRGAGWGLLVVGVVLSLGPRLADASGFVMMGSNLIAMPASWLETIDYPVVRSGMYHRFLVLASLGVALLVAGGTSVVNRRGSLLAWGCVLILVGDALYQSRDRWPRDSQSIPGMAAYAEMAADPEPGAVVVFPLRINDTGGGSQIMLSTLHGRATTGLPRYDYWERSKAPAALLEIFESASDSDDTHRYLAEQGIRYVLWTPWVQYRDKDAVTLSELSTLLGAPQADGELRWWRIESN